MSKSVLIVGGTGQIGLAAARALESGGHRVTLANRGSKRIPKGVSLAQVTLDRDNTRELLSEARKHDVVVDTVAFSVDHAEQLAMLAGDVESVVAISTGSVYLGTNGTYFDIGRDESTYPTFPVPIDESLPTITAETQTYGPMKAAMERVLLTSDVPVSILRPAAVHGPYSSRLREWYFIKRAIDKRPHVVLSRHGASRFSTSSTANIAALIDACIRTPGSRVLNAVDEEGFSVREIASEIFDLMGRDVEIHGFDGPAMDSVGATPWDAPHPFVCSMARAKDEVGYVPSLTYRQALQADIAWVTAEVREAEAAGGSWQDVFPQIVDRHGVDGWFPYSAEDDCVREGAAD